MSCAFRAVPCRECVLGGIWVGLVAVLDGREQAEAGFGGTYCTVLR